MENWKFDRHVAILQVHSNIEVEILIAIYPNYGPDEDPIEFPSPFSEPPSFYANPDSSL